MELAETGMRNPTYSLAVRTDDPRAINHMTLDKYQMIHTSHDKRQRNHVHRYTEVYLAHELELHSSPIHFVLKERLQTCIIRHSDIHSIALKYNI